MVMRERSDGETHKAVRAGEPAIVVEDVSKSYGPAGSALFALDHISLTVHRGEFVCLVGATGCGKTTLLNVISGLDRPHTGRVRVSGSTGFLFQEPALFPWLTVAGNIDLALRLRREPKHERRRRVPELIDLVHLTGFADKRPHQLSGGMRQRVSLARALAQDATVLLMDEPFGALDAITRDVMHDEVERIWRETDLTVLFVTHNVREAVRLGDRVLLLSSRPGRVVSEFVVDLERPRRIESQEVSSLSRLIVDRLREEVRRHAASQSQS